MSDVPDDNTDDLMQALGYCIERDCLRGQCRIRFVTDAEYTLGTTHKALH